MQELCSCFKTWRNGYFTNPQDLNRAVTFADDTITDRKKNVRNIRTYTITLEFMVVIILTNLEALA
jgi:mRNA-degrading endonuclease HigB of HigAB toxin-antitoxin module